MSAERFTAVFTGSLLGRKPGEYLYLTMSEEPLAPGGSRTLRRGRPPYGGLGREVSFQELPEGCRRLILDHYHQLWSLDESKGGVV